MQIMVVGTHGSGKSTLVAGLQQYGYTAYSFAQEHSASPRVWRRRQPDILVALYCSYETLVARRGVRWPKAVWRRQLVALGDAWAQADIRLQTDPFEPAEVVARVAARLRQVARPPNNGNTDESILSKSN